MRFRNVLFPRTDHRKVQRFLIYAKLRFGDLESRLGCIKVLLACGAAAGRFFQPLIVEAGVREVGLSRIHVCTGLIDFLGPRPVFEPLDHMPLCVNPGFGQRCTCLEPLHFHRAHDLPLLHPVPFVHKDGFYPFVPVEREVYLTEVQVSIQHELVRGGPGGVVEPQVDGGHPYYCGKQDEHNGLFHCLVSSGQTI